MAAAGEAAAALAEVGAELLDSEEPAGVAPDLASPNPGSEELVEADLALANLDPDSEEPAGADPVLAIPDAAAVGTETSPNSVAAVSPCAAVAAEVLATPIVHPPPYS